MARIRKRSGGAGLAILFAFVTIGGVAFGSTEADPPESDVAVVEGLEMIRAGRIEAARQRLEAALALRPDWAEAQSVLALTFVKEGRWETAAKLYRRALELDPELHSARIPYGWCLYYLGNLEQSRRNFESYLEVDPDLPDAIYALAMIAFDEDELDAAEKLFRKVIMLGRARRDVPRQALAHTRLSDLFLRRGDPSRAKLELNQALRLTPDNPKVHFKLSRVLDLLGESAAAEEARRNYERLSARTSRTTDEPDPFAGP